DVRLDVLPEDIAVVGPRARHVAAPGEKNNQDPRQCLFHDLTSLRHGPVHNLRLDFARSRKLAHAGYVDAILIELVAALVVRGALPDGIARHIHGAWRRQSLSGTARSRRGNRAAAIFKAAGKRDRTESRSRRRRIEHNAGESVVDASVGGEEG